MRARGKKQAHASGERWLLTYADLITLLVAFFIIMYGMSATDAVKFQSLAGSMQKAFNVDILQGQDSQGLNNQGGPNIVPMSEQEKQDFQFITKEINAFSESQSIGDELQVSANKEGVVISLSGNLLFNSGRTQLRLESRDTLNKVVDILTSIHNEVRIEGHTDNVPTNSTRYPTNWELSSERALTVVRYMIDFGGLEPKRFSAVGYGEFRPIANNGTPEGRARNRRVDILIIYPAGTK